MRCNGDSTPGRPYQEFSNDSWNDHPDTLRILRIIVGFAATTGICTVKMHDFQTQMEPPSATPRARYSAQSVAHRVPMIALILDFDINVLFVYCGASSVAENVYFDHFECISYRKIHRK